MGFGLYSDVDFARTVAECIAVLKRSISRLNPESKEYNQMLCDDVYQLASNVDDWTAQLMEAGIVLDGHYVSGVLLTAVQTAIQDVSGDPARFRSDLHFPAIWGSLDAEYREVIREKCLRMVKSHMRTHLDLNALRSHCELERWQDIQAIYDGILEVEHLADHWIDDSNGPTRNDMNERLNNIIKMYRRTAMEKGASTLQSRLGSRASSASQNASISTPPDVPHAPSSSQNASLPPDVAHHHPPLAPLPAELQMPHFQIEVPMDIDDDDDAVSMDVDNNDVAQMNVENNEIV